MLRKNIQNAFVSQVFSKPVNKLMLDHNQDVLRSWLAKKTVRVDHMVSLFFDPFNQETIVPFTNELVQMVKKNKPLEFGGELRLCFELIEQLFWKTTSFDVVSSWLHRNRELFFYFCIENALESMDLDEPSIENGRVILQVFSEVAIAAERSIPTARGNNLQTTHVLLLLCESSWVSFFIQGMDQLSNGHLAFAEALAEKILGEQERDARRWKNLFGYAACSLAPLQFFRSANERLGSRATFIPALLDAFDSHLTKSRLQVGSPPVPTRRAKRVRKVAAVLSEDVVIGARKALRASV